MVEQVDYADAASQAAELAKRIANDLAAVIATKGRVTLAVAIISDTLPEISVLAT